MGECLLKAYYIRYVDRTDTLGKAKLQTTLCGFSDIIWFLSFSFLTFFYWKVLNTRAANYLLTDYDYEEKIKKAHHVLYQTIGSFMFFRGGRMLFEIAQIKVGVIIFKSFSWIVVISLIIVISYWGKKLIVLLSFMYNHSVRRAIDARGRRLLEKKRRAQHRFRVAVFGALVSCKKNVTYLL